MLDRVGESEIIDEAPTDDRRAIVARAHAPLDPPFAHAFLEYKERYERLADGSWRLTAYRYEFQQRPPPGRRAFHWHEPWAYHSHCLDPRAPDTDDHYRGYEVDVFEAHAEFLRLYAAGTIDCSGLHPLFR